MCGTTVHVQLPCTRTHTTYPILLFHCTFCGFGRLIDPFRLVAVAYVVPTCHSSKDMGPKKQARNEREIAPNRCLQVRTCMYLYVPLFKIPSSKECNNIRPFSFAYTWCILALKATMS